MKITFTLVVLFLSTVVRGKEISLSFDDAPRDGGYRFNGMDRTVRLIGELKKADVKQVIFYSQTNRINSPERLERMKLYQKAGHLIGNHTHTHPSANKIAKEDYIKNFFKAESVLKEDGLLSKYFRYPYLHRGSNVSDVRWIHGKIMKAGYIDGYVTVDNYDWYMEHLLQEASREGKNIDYNQLRKFYIETLIKCVEFYDGLAVKELGTSPRHILLLHENDLAALFIGDLVKALRSAGWEIITPVESYQEPLLEKFPSSITRHNQGRIVARVLADGYEGVTNSGFEGKEIIEKLFEDYKVIRGDK